MDGWMIGVVWWTVSIKASVDLHLNIVRVLQKGVRPSCGSRRGLKELTKRIKTC